jgi:Tol biopolymer transport system component
MSPDGKWVAFSTFDQNQWKMGLMSFESGELVKTFDLPPLSRTAWQPDGRAIAYVDTRAGVSNIWAQAITGGPPKQLTHFTSGTIFDFCWSPDGKQFVLSRGTTTSDVVLINDVKVP